MTSACPQIVGQPQVVHYQAAGLVLEYPGSPWRWPASARGPALAYPGTWCADWARRIRFSHISRTQYDAEGIIGVAESVGQCLPPGLVPHVLLPLRRVRGRAGHYYFDAALGVIVVVPFGAQAYQFLVKVNAELRRLMQTTIAFPSKASRRCSKLLNDVPGNLPDPVFGADYGLELGPLGLQPLPCGSISSPSVASSKSGSMVGFSASSSSSLARRPLVVGWVPWPRPRQNVEYRRC